MSKSKKTLPEVLRAIEGSGGIKSTIARRLAVSRNTVDRYLDKWRTAQEVFDEEVEAQGDDAESVLVTNIKLAKEKQEKDKKIVDAGDAKWYLSRVRKGKYSERKEFTGKDGRPVEVIIKEADDW